MGQKRRSGSSYPWRSGSSFLEIPFTSTKSLPIPSEPRPTGAPVLLTLDDLEDLGGYVAAEANHTTDKKLRKKLDAIFSKIQDLLETHADEESPKSLKIKKRETHC